MTPDQVARTVGGLFVNSGGKVLLGLRAPWKRAWPCHWDAIGGHVEENESLDEALLREASEEVGVTPTRFRLIARIKEREPEIHGDALHHIYAVTEWQGGDPVNASTEHTKIRWFAAAEIHLLTNIVDCDYPRCSKVAVNLIRPSIRGRERGARWREKE